jgi:glycosyltransferase involved in cell wall biosynthesis
VDNDYINPPWLECLRFFDQVVVPSKYGVEVIKNYDPALAKKTKMIYYGLNAGEFHAIPQSEKDAMRKVLNIGKKFVVGYVGRNQWRKDLYHLMKIFAKFKIKNPDSYLYIHAHPTTTAHDGGNLFQMAEMLGLKLGVDYGTPSPDFSENAGFAIGDLNKLYGIMDVFVSASTGEGFGLPMAEAMLAEVPVIAPDNTTVPELLGEGRGLIYKTNNTVCFGQTDQMRERPLADIDDAVDKLTFVKQFRNKEAVDKMKKKALEFAKTLTSEKMVDLFYDTLTPTPEIIIAKH